MATTPTPTHRNLPLLLLLVTLTLAVHALTDDSGSNTISAGSVEVEPASEGVGANASATGDGTAANISVGSPNATVGDANAGGNNGNAGGSAGATPRRGGHHRGRRPRRSRVAAAAGGAVPGVASPMPMPVDVIKDKETRYENHMAREFLDAHNSLRNYFGEQPYTWNRTLALYARRWSAQLKESCSMTHSGGPYGENLFWGTGERWRAADAVQNWALEHNYYDQKSNSCLPGRMCGHYTQIVWKSSMAIGCARVECNQGGVVVICSYDPPGNYVGESPFQG